MTSKITKYLIFLLTATICLSSCNNKIEEIFSVKDPVSLEQPTIKISVGTNYAVIGVTFAEPPVAIPKNVKLEGESDYAEVDVLSETEVIYYFEKLKEDREYTITFYDPIYYNINGYAVKAKLNFPNGENKFRTARWETIYTSPLANTDGSYTFDKGWSCVDSNEDDQTWDVIYDSSSPEKPKNVVQMSYKNYNSSDDWLISPGISLESNAEYKIQFYVKTQWAYTTHKLDIYASLFDTPKLIMSEQPIYTYTGGDSSYNNIEINFTPTQTNIYYFSFHDLSYCSSTHLRLTGFKILKYVIP